MNDGAGFIDPKAAAAALTWVKKVGRLKREEREVLLLRTYKRVYEEAHGVAPGVDLDDLMAFYRGA